MIVAITVLDGMIYAASILRLFFILSFKLHYSIYTLFVWLFTCCVFLWPHILYVSVARVKLSPDWYCFGCNEKYLIAIRLTINVLFHAFIL